MSDQGDSSNDDNNRWELQEPSDSDESESASDRRVKHDYHDHMNEIPPPEYFFDGGEDLMIPVENEDAHCRKRMIDTSSRPALLSFTIKLHAMLDRVEKEGLQNIVSWQPHGRCFVIHKSELFKDLLERFFGVKMASFTRQLNMYGFKRIYRGRDKGGYYHECFLRGRVFLANKIQRTRIKGTGTRAKSNPDEEPDFYAMPWLEDLSHYSGKECETMGKIPRVVQKGMHLSWPQVMLNYLPQGRSAFGAIYDKKEMTCKISSWQAEPRILMDPNGTFRMSPITLPGAESTPPKSSPSCLDDDAAIRPVGIRTSPIATTVGGAMYDEETESHIRTSPLTTRSTRRRASVCCQREAPRTPVRRAVPNHSTALKLPTVTPEQNPPYQLRRKQPVVGGRQLAPIFELHNDTMEVEEKGCRMVEPFLDSRDEGPKFHGKHGQHTANDISNHDDLLDLDEDVIECLLGLGTSFDDDDDKVPKATIAAAGFMHEA